MANEGKYKKVEESVGKYNKQIQERDDLDPETKAKILSLSTQKLDELRKELGVIE